MSSWADEASPRRGYRLASGRRGARFGRPAARMTSSRVTRPCNPEPCTCVEVDAVLECELAHHGRRFRAAGAVVADVGVVGCDWRGRWSGAPFVGGVRAAEPLWEQPAGAHGGSARAADVDFAERLADFHGGAFRGEDFDDPTGLVGRNIAVGFVGGDRYDRLFARDAIALTHEPLGNRSFDDAFAQLGITRFIRCSPEIRCECIRPRHPWSRSQIVEAPHQ